MNCIISEGKTLREASAFLKGQHPAALTSITTRPDVATGSGFIIIIRKSHKISIRGIF